MRLILMLLLVGFQWAFGWLRCSLVQDVVTTTPEESRRFQNESFAIIVVAALLILTGGIFSWSQFLHEQWPAKAG